MNIYVQIEIPDSADVPVGALKEQYSLMLSSIASGVMKGTSFYPGVSIKWKAAPEDEEI